MRDHGYETVGDMLCVAGKNYSALLRERIGDFVGKDGVAYFKWDGIQFSCSEPNHGHPVDVYSRRAVLQSVAAMCLTARERNPNVFLNITSGTWMSPWWVQYANTIWMQGADYGFADVPSISMRDGAITYRDFVLYKDWKLKDLWFPIANLMTPWNHQRKTVFCRSSEGTARQIYGRCLAVLRPGASRCTSSTSHRIYFQTENGHPSRVRWHMGAQKF